MQYLGAQHSTSYMGYNDKTMILLLTKVQFWGTSTMTAVETQGYPGGTGRVRLYRLEFSTDCVNFQPILDDFGRNKVLSDILYQEHVLR